jgi:IS5 family transposase
MREEIRHAGVAPPALPERGAGGLDWLGAVDASGFQRDQTNPHYRNRANYSLQKMKTTILIDVETLGIKDMHFTTRKSWDGHIGMQIFQRSAEDLHTFAADKNHS